MSSVRAKLGECNSTGKLDLGTGSGLRKVGGPSGRVDVGSRDEDAPVQLSNQHADVGPLLPTSSAYTGLHPSMP